MLTVIKCKRVETFQMPEKKKKKKKKKKGPEIIEETWTLLMYVIQVVHRQKPEALGCLNTLADVTRVSAESGKSEFKYAEGDILNELKELKKMADSASEVVQKTADAYYKEREIALEKYRKEKEENKRRELDEKKAEDIKIAEEDMKLDVGGRSRANAAVEAELEESKINAEKVKIEADDTSTTKAVILEDTDERIKMNSEAKVDTE